MREMVQFLATALVAVVAALCVLVQVAHVDRAIDGIHHDDGAVIQQVGSVSSDQGGRDRR